jgi:hypothetical protein
MMPMLLERRKKGQKNNIEEDKLLVTAWLNVSQDAIKELIKQKAPTGAEFINTSMQTRRLILIALKFLS